MTDSPQDTPKKETSQTPGVSISDSVSIRVYADTNHLLMAEALASHVAEFYAQGGRVIFLEDKKENQDQIDKYLNGRAQSFRAPKQGQMSPFSAAPGTVEQAQIFGMGSERSATSLSEAGLKCLLDECKKYRDLKVVCVDVPLENQKASDYVSREGYNGTLGDPTHAPKNEKERKKIEEEQKALREERGKANAGIVENIADYFKKNYKNQPLPVSLLLIGAGHTTKGFLGDFETVNDLLAKQFPGQVALVELSTTPEVASQGMRRGASGGYKLYLADPFAEKVRANLEFLEKALGEAKDLPGFEAAKIAEVSAKIQQLKGALGDHARLGNELKQLEDGFSKENAPKDNKKAYEAIRDIVKVSQSYVRAYDDSTSEILTISGRESAEKTLKDAQKKLVKEVQQKQPKQSSSLTLEIDLSALNITGGEVEGAVKQHNLPLNSKAAAAIRGVN